MRRPVLNAPLVYAIRAREAVLISGAARAIKSLEKALRHRYDSHALRLSESIGEVAERSIAPVLKTGVSARGPGVRIPPSPPRDEEVVVTRRPFLFCVAAFMTNAPIVLDCRP
jgi:hypothetical protein